MKKTFTLFLLLMGVHLSGSGISGNLTDAATGKAIAYGNIGFYQEGVLRVAAESNKSGCYTIELDPGEYTVEGNFIAYCSSLIECVTVQAGVTKLNIPLKQTTENLYLCVLGPRPVKSKPETKKKKRRSITLDKWPYKIGAQEVESCESKLHLSGVINLWNPTEPQSVAPALIATVALYKEDKFVRVVETDAKGRFELLDLDPLIYSVQINYLGYKEVVIEDLDLNIYEELTVDLEPDQTIITTVQIMAYKSPISKGCGWTCVNTVASDDKVISQDSTTLEPPSLNVERQPYKVFPNPASAVLQVDMSTDYDQLRLYSVQGSRTHLDKELHSGLNRLDISTLVSGQYVVLFYKQGTLMDTELLQVVQD